MIGPTRPRGVHLVGSVPLPTAEEVFRTMSAELGDRLRRLPDGETGERSDWIVWQLPVLSAPPIFEIMPPDPDHYRPLPRVRARPGEDPSRVEFGRLGYADAARESYAVFARLRRDGVVPRSCRFQVCLPTPVAPIGTFVAPEDQAAVEKPYERRMLEELAEIVGTVPSEQLAVQWDTTYEFGMLEGVFNSWFPDTRAGILERLLGLGALVPESVELGYHLCYGDAGHEHFVEPRDTSWLVEVANALTAGLDRPLSWIHMPVPRGRQDDAYFAPLRELRLRPETELYLGLVHRTDGVEGARRRIEAASRAVVGFGVATECGWGRRPAASLPELVAIQRAVSAPVHSAAGTPPAPFSWPEGFRRVPEQEWVHSPLDSFGLQYDTVENHGWYRNLDLTVEQLAGALLDGQVLIDYSGGTGILVDRLLNRVFDRQLGVVIVDSSPKFLRVALSKFKDDERIAFRLIRFLKEQKRLEYVDEVLESPLSDHGGDAIASTNAIHLYYDLPETLASWTRVLRPGALAFIQSGNIRNPMAAPNEWIIDETVHVIHEVAVGLVRNQMRYAKYRPLLEDEERMGRYAELRQKFFLPVRPLDHYLQALEAAGFVIDEVTNASIEAKVSEWYDFLATYHEGVLGWVGGSERIDGRPPSPQAVLDRLALIRHAMDVLFGGRQSFRCVWTYLSCRVA